MNFQLFVYGGGDVRFHNQALFNGSIFAPDSLVRFHNNAAVTGAISAEYTDFHNRADFTWHDGFSDAGSSQGEYERENWVECKPKRTNANDPESGC